MINSSLQANPYHCGCLLAKGRIMPSRLRHRGAKESSVYDCDGGALLPPPPPIATARNGTLIGRSCQ